MIISAYRDPSKTRFSPSTDKEGKSAEMSFPTKSRFANLSQKIRNKQEDNYEEEDKSEGSFIHRQMQRNKQSLEADSIKKESNNQGFDFEEEKSIFKEKSEK